MAPDDIRALIRTVFEQVPQPAQPISEPRDCCGGCERIRSALTNVSREELSEEHFEVISLEAEHLDREAYTYFLPACMIRAIDTPGSELWLSVQIWLTSQPDDHFKERQGLMTQAQISSIVEFLKFTRLQGAAINRYFESDKVFEKRLNWWNNFLAVAQSE